MVEKLTYIELADGQYPIKCDLAVLEAVQEEYGEITIFERELLGLKKTGKKGKDGKNDYIKGEPSIKAVRFVLPLMINEGIDIENRMEKAKRKHITDKDLQELVAGVNVFNIADQLHAEFVRCFVSKNQNSTQEETNNR